MMCMALETFGFLLGRTASDCGEDTVCIPCSMLIGGAAP